MSDDTVFIRGAGGAIFEMTVPTAPHALELWEEKIAKGEHTVIENAVWADRPDGSKYLIVPDEPSAPAEPVPPAKWKKAELIAWLTEAGVEHDQKDTVPVLVELVEMAMAAQAADNQPPADPGV